MKKSIFQKLDDLHPMVGAAIFGFVPAFIAWGLIVLVGINDTEPTLNEGTLTIEASRHLVFIENRNLLMEIIGLALSAIIPAAYAWKYKGLSAGTGEYSGGHTYAIAWVLALVLMLAPFVGKNNSAEYSKIVDEKTFQYLKANPAEVDKQF
jgi:hypothetical protein